MLSPTATHEAVRPSSRFRPPRAAGLLIVEDERMLSDLFARYLRGQGFLVKQAPGGEEAARLVAEDPAGFRLALIDVGLPGEDGRALAARLRRLSPGLPVLLMSGSDVASLRGQSPDVGVADYLQKPFTMAELCEQVVRALRPVA